MEIIEEILSIESKMEHYSLSKLATATIFGLAFILTGTSALADSYVIDFEKDDSGATLTAGSTDLRSYDPYDDLFAAGVGLLLSTDAPGSRPLNLYDTEGVTNEDDDLQRKFTGSATDWAGGNLTAAALGQAEGEVLDNILIINKNTTIGTPNDNAGGGKMILNFGVALSSFGFDFVDMDLSTSADLIFTDNSGSTPVSVTLSFADFEEGSGSIHETANVAFGNRNANRILDITAVELGLTQFDQVTFDMRSSGGIGTIYVESVPEPGSVLLLSAGFGMLLFRRRRRKISDTEA